jgi:hypothetical protein
MLGAAMNGMEHEARPLKWGKSIGNWEIESMYSEPIGGTRDKNLLRVRKKGFQQRVLAAIVGGIFLIGTMWLMVLYKARYTALVSTTLFVTVIGLLMAWILDNLRDVLSSTAAYAAVLVVFVGLNT